MNPCRCIQHFHSFPASMSRCPRTRRWQQSIMSIPSLFIIVIFFYKHHFPTYVTVCCTRDDILIQFTAFYLNTFYCSTKVAALTGCDTLKVPIINLTGCSCRWPVSEHRCELLNVWNVRQIYFLWNRLPFTRVTCTNISATFTATWHQRQRKCCFFSCA